ncbi:MAG TPA: HlyC/CorC family transporter [Beijerinckiaceae bacterium]|nr:HlyC/CorC family transporter [Rhodoblastus sp.]MCB9997700.1 HlyC/CorC family transporter [Methylobacteriaceae bacterium]MCO5088926.1 HlyC/CorC family transporter [Methylobacteriaceae bacterium]HRY02244.1 HlyC/CorC family transporter [Beijerinckiaceae bacterium]
MEGAIGGPLSINPWTAAAVVGVCILLSAFFAGSETALTATSRARMHALEKGGDRRAATVNRLLESRNRFIGAMLLGNTLVNIASSAVATSLLVGLVGDKGAIYATLLMTAMLLIFAEVMPKTLAINFPEKMSLTVARPVAVAVAVFGPVLVAVEAIVHGVLSGVGIRIGEARVVPAGHDELKSTVDYLHQEGGVARADRDMFGGLLDLKDLSVSDVMVHRTKMAAVNAELAPRELVREVLASPYTRLPLWRGEPENIIGVLHAKDLLRELESVGDPDKVNIDDIALDAWFVPETTSLGDQLQAFRKRKTHFALVVDEYGVVMGLVTLEDILEEIVGDISDEHDIAAQGVRQTADGGVIVDGAVPIRDLNRIMDWRLPDEEATTLAGLVIHEAQMIPEPGQTFTFHGFRFEVLRKTRNRITSLRVTPATRLQ